MRKIFAFILISFISCLQVIAQTQSDTSKTWITGGFTSVNFNQVSLTNWAAGGESSASITGLFNTFANYKNNKTKWDNSLDIGYGLIKQGNQPLRKNEDKIDLNSKYGRLATGKLYYTSQLNFRSQFAPGYNYPNDSIITSRFLSPGFLTIALGFDYKPNNFLSVFLSPATGKFTFVVDQYLADTGAFGVEKAIYDSTGVRLKRGRKFRPEFGASLTAKFQKDILENVNLITKINLFNNYTDKNKGNRKNIDINLEMLINMKVNKYISASLFANLIYDNDITIPTYKTINDVKTVIGKGPKIQFKEVFGIGFSYKL